MPSWPICYRMIQKPILRSNFYYLFPDQSTTSLYWIRQSCPSPSQSQSWPSPIVHWIHPIIKHNHYIGYNTLWDSPCGDSFPHLVIHWFTVPVVSIQITYKSQGPLNGENENIVLLQLFKYPLLQRLFAESLLVCIHKYSWSREQQNNNNAFTIEIRLFIS